MTLTEVIIPAVIDAVARAIGSRPIPDMPVVGIPIEMEVVYPT